MGLNPRIPNLEVKHMAKVMKKTVNLALQDGGAHGAFAWGVLDKLVEDGRLEIDGARRSVLGP
jgi:NTE family protein